MGESSRTAYGPSGVPLPGAGRASGDTDVERARGPAAFDAFRVGSGALLELAVTAGAVSGTRATTFTVKGGRLVTRSQREDRPPAGGGLHCRSEQRSTFGIGHSGALLSVFGRA